MINSYDRLYVFVIKNGLEYLTDDLQVPLHDHHSFFSCLDSLEADVSGISNDNKKNNINLILINKDCISPEVITRINSLFVEKNCLSKPRFLYLSALELSNEEVEIISSAQNYFYLLQENSSICEKNVLCYNLLLMVKFIFHKIENIERLNDYIVSSFETIVDSAIITKQKTEIESLNEELNAMSRTDFLTKVLNRRAFFEKLEEEKKRALRDNWRIINAKNDFYEENAKEIVERRAQQPPEESGKPVGMLLEHFGRFSCILIDIDHFKLVNDNYGHLKGDEVLKRMGEAMAMKNIFRENDVLARYGGEEFIILLPGTSAHNARIPADRFREFIKSLQFFDDSGKLFNITISLGISEYRPTDQTNEEMINRSDQALYFAKEHGRDQVAIYDDVFKGK